MRTDCQFVAGGIVFWLTSVAKPGNLKPSEMFIRHILIRIKFPQTTFPP